MSQSTTDERWSDCPRKAISCDASFGLQNQLAKKLPEASSESGFLGTFYNDSFTVQHLFIIRLRGNTLIRRHMAYSCTIRNSPQHQFKPKLL